MAAYELMCVGQQTSVCTSSLKLGGIVRGLMDENVFGNFFNQIIQFLNACIDPETAVTCTHGHFNQSEYAHFGQIR